MELGSNTDKIETRKEENKNDLSNLELGMNLDKFFKDVERIKDEHKEVEKLYQRLQHSHEKSKTLQDAKSVKELRSDMDSDVSATLMKAKLIKDRLEALERANAANRSLPGCGPGSSSDRTRNSVVNGLKKKLKDFMDGFNRLREQISDEYRETVEQRYYKVTGEKPDDRTVELLISTGESETFLQKAIQEQRRGQIMEMIWEIEERHDAMKEMERSLEELHQVFLDMATMVEQQGEELNDIESQVARANSYVRDSTQQLQTVKKTQQKMRKWNCISIILLIILIFLILSPIFVGVINKKERD
ncbi:hypothetical protein NE237_005408 [Protea cynaroides]|uniref:t-SNARE coiled-coil homology domain-containing protein n=1 Tax=Protea cynaroides TaxID=273540 RepID=A0A9Q0KL97_9MAGN|nr:hypothetical protein NE237_005408 [Protea cynaroides]